MHLENQVQRVPRLTRAMYATRLTGRVFLRDAQLEPREPADRSSQSISIIRRSTPLRAPWVTRTSSIRLDAPNSRTPWRVFIYILTTREHRSYLSCERRQSRLGIFDLHADLWLADFTRMAWVRSNVKKTSKRGFLIVVQRSRTSFLGVQI